MSALAMLDVASLPDDAKILKAHLSDCVQKYAEARRYAEGLEQAITKLRRMHFGPKSERIPQGQQIFGFYGTLEASKPAAAQESPKKPPAKRKPDREGARVLPLSMAGLCEPLRGRVIGRQFCRDSSARIRRPA